MLIAVLKTSRNKINNNRINSPVQHVDKVEETIERRHHQISEGKIHEEVVGDRPHAAMCC